MTSSAIQQIPCAFHEVRFSPPTAPCPRCRREVRRAWEATRIAIDAALEDVALLRVRVGVYRCHACGQHFRAQPPFLRPGASYTNRVVAAAVHAVFSDGMAARRVPARLARDLPGTPQRHGDPRLVPHLRRRPDARRRLHRLDRAVFFGRALLR
jgi:uncharacterized protein (UPF0212 family)